MYEFVALYRHAQTRLGEYLETRNDPPPNFRVLRALEWRDEREAQKRADAKKESPHDETILQPDTIYDIRKRSKD